MKLFIDQDIAGRTASKLRDLDYDAVSAFELGMNRTKDEDNIEFAIATSRIIATLDGDYHRIIATRGLVMPSVIHLHEKQPNSTQASHLIHRACLSYRAELLQGCLISCSFKNMRFRFLPI